MIGRKDASETLEEQQRSRVLHVRREAKTRIWDSEREVGERLHQALRRVLPLSQIPNRSHELPEGSSLLQRVHSPVSLISEERHSKVFSFVALFYSLPAIVKSMIELQVYASFKFVLTNGVEIGDT